MAAQSIAQFRERTAALGAKVAGRGVCWPGRRRHALRQAPRSDKTFSAFGVSS
ncbi:hypothetical protein SAMN05216337_106840 [Bradyrhizobium brasilense]|uniref:Uncharacterized protein n=1 Tax=Bradyrhizobium brasilense TaxID=1419277 RepID=A0A1G7N6V6_9BRAD|nr:hypothetical protein SAMN05216337_106840 [Bradyrhizobium brasilense]